MSAERDRQAQLEFAQALRDPSAPMPDWIEARPLQIYRELAFNNLQRALARSFTVSRSLIADARWNRLIAAFFAEMRTHEPQLRRLPREFVRWLTDDQTRDAPTWWIALCRYEHVELELTMADIELPALLEPQGDTLARQLLDGRPQLSPLARLFDSDWPVHRIDTAFANNTPDDAQPDPAMSTHLVIWRDRADAVRFLELNELGARLLRALPDQPMRSGRKQLQQLAEDIGQPADTVIEAGAQLLCNLYLREILLAG